METDAAQEIKDEILSLRQAVAKMARIRTESESIGELAEALAKAQGEMTLVKEHQSSHYGKYADLAEIIKTSRGPLSKNGLSVIQRVILRGDTHVLLTRLCHKSGEWIESAMHLNPAKKDIQSMGSEITYVRRYSLCSIVGITSSQDDDDGYGAMSDEQVAEKQKEAGVTKRITAAQSKQISELLVDLPKEMQKKVMNSLNTKYGIDRVSDLPDTAVKEVLTGLTKVRHSVGLE